MSFGLKYSNYKILVQARSGNRYIIWYADILEVEVGQEVPIDFNTYYDRWQTVRSPPETAENLVSQKLAK